MFPGLVGDKMTKPVIVAFCGKSAAGKDTMAKNLCSVLRCAKQDAYLMVGDTTRPPRPHEVEGLNYHFLPYLTFLSNLRQDKYLEWTDFKGWHYGTLKSEIKAQFNVGVFNPKGLQQLMQYSDQYVIVPVYIDVPVWTRLNRSYKRELRWHWEYFRRAWHDHKDFEEINLILDQSKYSLVLTHAADEFKLIDTILWHLKEAGLLTSK